MPGEPLQANFVTRRDFLAFLRQNGEAALRAAALLSEIYHAARQEVRYLGFSKTAAETVARFLLDITAAKMDGLRSIKVTLTHQEIGEMIGASRETVTRLLARLKRRNLLEAHGASPLVKG